MRQLTPAGRQTITDLAQRHGFSAEAVLSMLEGVVAGNGTMAQFSHPEFSGSGQWMRGGMVMVSDMFNNTLKGRIDALCRDLAGLVASQPDLLRPGSASPPDSASLFARPAAGESGEWWPAGLGAPDSTGAQNDIRYAYFARPRRLAISTGGRVTLYDTLDHQIGGVSQQQSSGGSLTFSSQHGRVEIAGLPVVSAEGQTTAQAASPPAQDAPPHGADADIFARIEKLADLRGKGVLTEEEFAAKKADLLGRL